MAKKYAKPSEYSSHEASNHASSYSNMDDSMNNALSSASPTQTDSQESNDLLKAILGKMQSIDKNVKKLKKRKSKSSIQSSLGHEEHNNNHINVNDELTTTSEQHMSQLQAAEHQDREQHTIEHQLGSSLQTWMDLLFLLEQDSELSQFVPFSTEDTSSNDMQMQMDNEQALKLVTMIACLAQWDKVTDIWHLLAERCKHYQRPATDDELLILSSAVNIHNLTWRDKKAKLQSIDCPTTYNYKQHQRGNTTGETITAEWLPTLINAGATATLNAVVYTE